MLLVLRFKMAQVRLHRNNYMYTDPYHIIPNQPVMYIPNDNSMICITKVYIDAKRISQIDIK